MKSYITILFVLFTFVPFSMAQRYKPRYENRYEDRYREAKNAVYVEVGGNALAYSINYDRKIGDQFSIRGGVEFFGVATTDGGAGIVAVPVMVNYLPGRGSNRMELGVGKLFAQVGASYHGTGHWEEIGDGVWTATVGFRHQPRRGGLLFRVGLTPIFGDHVSFVWAGGSVGIAF